MQACVGLSRRQWPHGSKESSRWGEMFEDDDSDGYSGDDSEGSFEFDTGCRGQVLLLGIPIFTMPAFVCMFDIDMNQHITVEW